MNSVTPSFKQPKGTNREVEPLTAGARKLWAEHRDANCTNCELHKWAKTVCLFGNGPVPAKGMIIGEGPGSTEDVLGRPFQGKSGEYLNRVLFDIDLNREDFYVSNATKCVVPRNVKTDPQMRESVKACSTYLEAEIAAVKPKVILAVGNYAYFYFAHKTGITKSRGKEFWSEKYNCLVVPTVHPAYIMQNPEYHEAFVADAIKFKNILLDKKPPPVEIFEVHTLEDFRQARKELWENPDGILTFDLETRGLLDYKPRFSQVWCMGVTRDGKKSYLIPLEHPQSPFIEEHHEDYRAWWKANYPNVQNRIKDEYREIVEGVCDLALLNRTSNHNIKFDMRHIIRLAQRYNLYDKYYDEHDSPRKEVLPAW